MSLLDDARRLAGADLPKDEDGRCWFCDEIPGYEGHHAPCPWLSLPTIVAVLEAVQAFVDATRGQSHVDLTAAEAVIDAFEEAES